MKFATLMLFIKFVLKLLEENGIGIEETLRHFAEAEDVHPIALRDIRDSIRELGFNVVQPARAESAEALSIQASEEDAAEQAAAQAEADAMEKRDREEREAREAAERAQASGPAVPDAPTPPAKKRSFSDIFGGR